MNYFIAPRSGEKSYKNFESTIKNGVPLDRIKRFLTPEGVKLLSNQEIIYAWGNREGTKEQWERMVPGDTVIFYAKKKLVMAGKLYFKQHNPDLALAMWPPDEKGNPWAYTFFLKDLEYIDIPIEVFNKTAGYKSNFIIQGFMNLKGEHLSKIESEYGSVEKMLGLFEDKTSDEVPLESEPIYVNLNNEIHISLGNQDNITPAKLVEKVKTDKISKKIDYVKKAKTNAINGSKGEELVLKYEKDRLKNIGREDLAEKVKRVSLESDSYGYDIESFDEDGTQRFIEVKSSTLKNKEIMIFLSSKELEIGKNLQNFYLYYVEGVNTNEPTITPISSPFDGRKFTIKPEGYLLLGSKI